MAVEKISITDAENVGPLKMTYCCEFGRDTSNIKFEVEVYPGQDRIQYRVSQKGEDDRVFVEYRHALRYYNEA